MEPYRPQPPSPWGFLGRLIGGDDAVGDRVTADFQGRVTMYATLRTLPGGVPGASVVSDASDREVQDRLSHMSAWVAASCKRGGASPAVAHTLEHLWRVRHQIIADVPKGRGIALSTWATRANAVLFLSDRTLRNPSGEVLVGEGALPQALPPYPEKAVARWARVREHLSSRGFETPPSVGPVGSEDEVDLRSAEQVQARVAALVVVAQRAIQLEQGRVFDEEALRRGASHTRTTDHETAFLRQARPSGFDCERMSQRVEAAAALLWANGRLDDLPWPDRRADIARIIELGGQRTFGRPRAMGEILDALDLHKRMHWWSQNRVVSHTPLRGLIPEVIVERRRALRWLLRVGNFDWEELPVHA